MVTSVKSDRICIVGLGYVGLPLAVAFAKDNSVVGFDISQDRIAALNNSYDETLEVDEKSLREVQSKIAYADSISAAQDCNVYIVTVPTPIDAKNKPDLGPLVAASTSVASVLNDGDLVIYESTVYPGITEDVCVPVLEKFSGMKYNSNFFCGYSPERVNPGDKENTLTKILKVTSGSTPEIAKRVDDLYKSVIEAGTYLAPSIKVAEASKVIENTQRDVNIALINELALIFDKMNLDTSEVLEAAATKWNFINLKPGLVGGHCIGIDPYYLTFKAEEVGYSPDLVLTARQINNSMGTYVADKTVRMMTESGCSLKAAEVLVLGATFKENCPDMRNTKVKDIVHGLSKFGFNVDVFDPWVDVASVGSDADLRFIEDPIRQGKKYDAIVVAVGHDVFKNYSVADYESISRDRSVIIDVKGVAAKFDWRL